MATIIHASLLFVFAICLSSPTFGDSLSTSQPGLNDSNINILFVSIVNDLPPGSGTLTFAGNFQPEPYVLEPGKPFTIFTNFDVQHCIMVWNKNAVKFDTYDPSKEGEHQRIYWSAREDGIYHSWDDATWDKRVSWQPINM